jgi:CRISPR/Cas system-associated exonuclease Cas4 (RecB family)
MEPDGRWTSPSDLADYAYCPRSHWYRYHPPRGGPTRDSQEVAREGTRYHERVLTAERHRAEWGGVYSVLLLLGLLLAGGGAWWVLRP